MESSGRVLIVEDDPGIQQVLSEILKKEGIPFDVAEDGQEAITLLGDGTYSVLLLDLMLPKLSGYNILQFIRNQGKGDRPAIFVVTANADEFMRRVDPTVVDGIIRKPFEVEEVRRLILGRVNKDVKGDQTARTRKMDETLVTELGSMEKGEETQRTKRKKKE